NTSSSNASDASESSSQRTSFDEDTNIPRPATAPLPGVAATHVCDAATTTNPSGDARQLGSIGSELYPLLVCGAAGSGDLEGLSRLWDVVTDAQPAHPRVRRPANQSHNNNSNTSNAQDDKDRRLLGGQAVTVGDGGLSLNQGDWEGRSPLHIACSAGYLEIVRFLLSHGASIHVRDRQNHTPLYDAATRSSDLEVVRLLRATGAHLNDAEVADCGWKLMIAATEGDQLRVALIAEAGFDLNRRLFDRRTVLHILAAEHRHEVLQFLLETYPQQLDLTLQDRLGRTCVDEAGACETCRGLFEAYAQDGLSSQEYRAEQVLAA
ncbi:hypothetical protein BGZ73_008960, partial [Actinomortierella ambigua]